MTGRDYADGGCEVCHHEPGRAGYRWIRWTELAAIPGERPMRVARSVEEFCPWLECPHRPGEHVALTCADCGAVAIVPAPGFAAVCPKCGGEMRKE